MSRHQYRHGRTLDALELRGCRLLNADQLQRGDTICFLDERLNISVESVEIVDRGRPRVRVESGRGTMINFYDPSEFIYVLR